MERVGRYLAEKNNYFSCWMLVFTTLAPDKSAGSFGLIVTKYLFINLTHNVVNIISQFLGAMINITRHLFGDNKWQEWKNLFSTMVRVFF